MRTPSASGWWAYPGAAVASVAIAFVVLALWRADPRVPLTYRSEALFNAMLVKATLEGGSAHAVPGLAAPGRLDLRDLALSDNTLHFAVIRLLGVASGDYAVVMNLFSLLTFPLTAVSALYVFRRFGLATLPALAGALLYAFTPFHLHRGQYHLFLAAYYLVPLAIMVTLWIASGAVAAVDARDARWSVTWCRGKLIGSAIVCVLVASSGTYYAFFACFFMLVAGARAALRGRDARYLALPIGLVVLTVAVLTAHYWPSIRYVHKHGGTRLVLRNPVDAETYGLKIWQLLAPVSGHRLEPAARFKDDLVTGRRLNESDDSSLGLIGSVGFLALLAGLVWPGRETEGPPGLMRDVAMLNVSAVLLATVGGLGALVALVAPQIRAYNRISIFIAFFALLAVVTGLDAVYRRGCTTPGRRAAFALGLGLLVVAGLYDQTPARAADEHDAGAAEFRRDDVFFSRLTESLPRDAMVFQLPAIPFPEHPTVYRMQDYDHLRGYLHGSGLRWSYGAMRGREGEAWQAWVTAQPVPRMVDTLAAAGFSGITVDGGGYADGAGKVVAELGGALAQTPVSHDHPRLFFFDLRPHQAALQSRATPAEWEARQDAAVHPLLMVWEHGCFDLERTPQGSTFRWCAAEGEWRLVNRARRPQRAALTMALASNKEGTLRLDGPLLQAEMHTGPVGRLLSETLSVPPGRHVIRFHSDAPRVRAPGDPRHLVFRVHDFRIEDR